MLPLRSKFSGFGMALKAPHRSLRRNFSLSAAVAQQPRKRIAVLGGGISGLTAAYRLSQELPKHRYEIVLLESQHRLGGWIDSERVKAPHQASSAATALIERGPRSIRPAGYSGMMMLELLKSLDLMQRMLKVPKTAASAQNRFIYYPDRLAKLPNSLASLFTALVQLPFLRRILPGVLREAVVPSRFLRPKSESRGEKQRLQSRETMQDESIDSFVTRRFGKPLAENLVSAVIHGIYAGDTRRLSVRSVLPFLWDSERVHGSILRSMLPVKRNGRYRALPESEAAAKSAKEQALKDVETRLGSELVKGFKNVSVYSFPNGVQEIVDALETKLRSADNVDIRLGEGVRSAMIHNDGSLSLHTASDDTISVDRVVSSVPSSQLASILPDRDALPHLSHNPSANVGVVNVVIRAEDTQKALLPVEGFGYLLPRSTPNNEDGILGVVFDSDSLPTQDTEDLKARPIKLTVMMGGSHWSSSSLPTQQDMKTRAISALVRHLGLSRELLEDANQTTVLPTLQKDCIPWYLVGHPTRMADLHKHLQSHATLADKLTLVGASYTGVSLNDCVAYATEAVWRIVEAEKDAATSSVVTGLETFEVPQHEGIGDSENQRQSKRAARPTGSGQTQGLFGPTPSPPSAMPFSPIRALHTSARRCIEPSSTKPTKTLEQILIDSVKASGPMPVSTYMRTCLLDPMQGYYSSANSPGTSREVLGSRGDFITSPEISQVFGELVAIFYLARWQSVGAPKRVRLVELGPGKGTLLADMLRTFSTFRPFLDSVKEIQLVETSEGLMELQLASITEALAAAGKKVVDAGKPVQELAADEVVVEWFPTVNMLPVQPEAFTVVTAHEFLDALPTHIFEKGHDGKFREVLVGLRQKSSITVLRPGAVPGTVKEDGAGTGAKDELAFVLSPGPTPWAQMLAQNNPRFTHLKAGQRVEISPESWAVARKAGELIAGRSAAPARSLSASTASSPSSEEQEKETARLAGASAGGVGLVIDYGEDRFFGSSFRAFKSHALVPVFETPGAVDLTVNVDFQHLKTAIQTTDADWLGPLDQADFLVGMGLQMRTERLVRGKDPEDDKRIKQAANRLVDETGMGTQYKVLAISAAPSQGADQTGKLVKSSNPLLYPFQLGETSPPSSSS